MSTSTFLTRYLGDSPVVYMIAGLSLLILIDLALTLVIAIRSKEINFRLLPDFIAPTLQYTIFLIATQALVIGTNGMSVINQGFIILQGLAFLSVLIKYYSSIRGKLKKLGMKIDPTIEAAIDQKLSVIVNTETTITTTTVNENGGEGS